MFHCWRSTIHLSYQNARKLNFLTMTIAAVNLVPETWLIHIAIMFLIKLHLLYILISKNILNTSCVIDSIIYADSFCFGKGWIWPLLLILYFRENLWWIVAAGFYSCFLISDSPTNDSYCVTCIWSSMPIFCFSFYGTPCVL